MTEDQELRHVRDLAARLAAPPPNVWWLPANEQDVLLDTKLTGLWGPLRQGRRRRRPRPIPCPIRNGDASMSCDRRKPWASHVRIWNRDVKRAPDWRDACAKPVISDEPEHEGDARPTWGSLAERLWNRVSGSRHEGTTLVYPGEHQPTLGLTGLPTKPGDYAIDMIDALSHNDRGRDDRGTPNASRSGPGRQGRCRDGRTPARPPGPGHPREGAGWIVRGRHG